MRINGLILTLLSVVVLTACNKKTTTDLMEYEGGRLDVNEMDFTYFEGKTKIDFKDSENDVRAKAAIRIRKDSVIWMTFSSVGITGGKCLINKDSITIINQLKKEYYVLGYEELSKRFNFLINYETIQAAAMGNLILARQESDRAISSDSATILRQKLNSVTVDNFIDKESHKILGVEMDESISANHITIKYRDFQFVGDQYFPFKGIISLFYKTENITLNTNIEFEYSKAEISEKPIRFPFRIPRKYVKR